MNIINKNPNLIPELQDNPPFLTVREADGSTPWTYVATNADGSRWVQSTTVPQDTPKTVSTYAAISTQGSFYLDTVDGLHGIGIYDRLVDGIIIPPSTASKIDDTLDVTAEPLNGVYKQTVDIIGVGTALNPQYKSGQSYLKTTSGIIPFGDPGIDDAENHKVGTPYTDETFKITTTNTTAKIKSRNVDGTTFTDVDLIPNKPYFAKYILPKTAGALTNAEMQLMELVSGGSSEKEIGTGATIPVPVTATTPLFFDLHSQANTELNGLYVKINDAYYIQRYKNGSGGADTNFKEVGTFAEINAVGEFVFSADEIGTGTALAPQYKKGDTYTRLADGTITKVNGGGSSFVLTPKIIKTVHLDDSAVTTVKIKKESVTYEKIALDLKGTTELGTTTAIDYASNVTFQSDVLTANTTFNITNLQENKNIVHIVKGLFVLDYTLPAGVQKDITKMTNYDGSKWNLIKIDYKKTSQIDIVQFVVYNKI